MRKTIIAAFLLVSAQSGMAFEWPWSVTDIEKVEYCKGLLTAGLASPVPAGDDRTELWLGWNHLVRDAGVGYEKNPEQFRLGREAFASVQSQEDLQVVLQQGRGECGLGRSGIQVTGF